MTHTAKHRYICRSRTNIDNSTAYIPCLITELICMLCLNNAYHLCSYLAQIFTQLEWWFMTSRTELRATQVHSSQRCRCQPLAYYFHQRKLTFALSTIATTTFTFFRFALSLCVAYEINTTVRTAYGYLQIQIHSSKNLMINCYAYLGMVFLGDGCDVKLY